jgi:hypothetical protein
MTPLAVIADGDSASRGNIAGGAHMSLLYMQLIWSQRHSKLLVFVEIYRDWMQKIIFTLLWIR